MSASRTKKERQAEATMGLTQKQKKELADSKRHKRNAVIYTIIGIVVVIAIALLLIWDNGVIQKHVTALEVGDKSYGVVDLDYYYYTTYSSYYSYASYYGLDTEEDLDKQEIYEGYTWDDMLRESAVSTLSYISMLATEAENAGYDLSEDGQNYINSAVSSVSLYASMYGYTENYYLQASFGKYMTEKDYERILTEYELASEYGAYKEDSFDITEEEIQTYYEENSCDLDTIDYTCYYVTFDQTETDDDGESVELDEDIIEANREEAEAYAQEIADALAGGDTETAADLAETCGATDYSNFSGISYYGYADWMLDTSHQAGACDVVENINSDDETVGYYAIYINERYMDEYYPANARVLSIYAEADEDDNYDMDACLEETQTILDEFETTDLTDEDFISVYDIYGDGTYEDGLAEGITKSDYNEEMTDWLFDDDRVAGDYALFADEDSSCCYIVYFCDLSDTVYWRTVAIDSLKDEKFDDWVEEAEDGYDTSEGFGYRFIG